MSRYKVGYKKPPLHSRFKKGQSGNPSGRPKKSVQKTMEIFEEEMMRKIIANEGNKKVKITAERAIFRKLIYMALQGNATALKQALQMLSGLENVEEMITVPQVVFAPPSEPRPYPESPIHGVNCDCQGCYDPA